MKKNYDNALTSMVDRGVQKTINKLVEDVNKLQSLQNNKLLSESDRIPLEEGFLDSIKFGLSKLGRYKAAGKIFGKGEADKEWKKKVKDLLDKKGNEVLKSLDKGVDELNTAGKGEFPNNKEQQHFLDIVLLIAGVYDTIKEATKKDIKDEDYLPIDVANALILDLRTYVKKFLDVDLAAVYSVVDSEDKGDNVITEKKVWKGKNSGKTNPDYEPSAGDVRDVLKKGSSDDDEKIDSDRMGKKGLASNKLPAILLLAGGSLAALGWVAQTQWLKTLIEAWFNTPGTEGAEAVYEACNYAPDAEGMVHWMSDVSGHAIENGEDVMAFIKEHGAENVSHMFDSNGGGDAMTQMGQLQELVSGDGASKSVGELFNSDTLGDMKGGRNLFGISKAASFVGKTLVKSAVKAVAAGTAGTVIAANLATIGSTILLPLGIGLFAAGLLVKGFREKGKRWSRAKTLDMLLQSLQTVKGNDKQVPVIIDPNPDPEPDKPTPQEPDEPEGGGEGGDDIPIGKDITVSEYTKVNRNTQLAYLSEKFLPPSRDYWSVMNIKRGTEIPSSLLDLALGGGKYKDSESTEAGFNKVYEKLSKANLFNKNIEKDKWIQIVLKNRPLLKWIRNTRKGIGSFIKSLNKTFPDLNLSGREVLKKGEAMRNGGQAMAMKDGVSPKPLMNEEVLNNALKTDFDEGIFMKNLPAFIEMVSLMYKTAKGIKLNYDKDVMFNYCESDNCSKEGWVSKDGEPDKTDDLTISKARPSAYNSESMKDQINSRNLMKEEIKRIKGLM